jgi:hypothetical protein
VLLVGGFAANAGSGTDVVNDSPLSGVLVLLLCTGLALVPATVQAAVLGSVTALLVRRAYLDPERRALLAAREAARTPAQVAAVQATTTPGRGWRRLGRYVGLSACVLGLVLLLAGRPAIGAVPLVAAIGTLLARVWRGVRSPQVAAVRSQLRQRAGLPSGRDDAALVAFRTAEMRDTAARLGWAPVNAAGSGLELLVEQLTARRSNVFRGSVDGTAFVVWDQMVLNPAVMALLLTTQESTELVLDCGRLTLSAREALIAPDRIDEQVRLAARIRDSGRSAMARLR